MSEALARALAVQFARHPDDFFAAATPATRQLRQGTDLYRILGEPTLAVRAALRARYGDNILESFQQLHRRYRVPSRLVENYARWISQGLVVDTYTALRELVRSSGVDGAGLFLHADHILEQRLHRMIRDGLAAHGVRSPGTALANTVDHRALEIQSRAFRCAGRSRIEDGLSVLIPSHEVSAYRVGRRLRALSGPPNFVWYYPHLGHNSKTALLAQFLPYRFEGAYTYQEMLDATLWVTHRHFGMPTGNPRSLTRGPIIDAIRDDLVRSIIEAVPNDRQTADLVVAEVRRVTGRRLSADSDALEGAVRNLLDARVPDAGLPTSWDWLNPLFTFPEVQLEAAADIIRFD